MSEPRKRYALVGTGGRAKMFIDAIVGAYQNNAVMVGLCDLSQTRMDWHNQQIAEAFDAAPIATYSADNFDRMVAETKPDTIIVTSMDSTHHLYINRAMELGCDGVLMNTAIAEAKDPIKMARAMKLAVEAGRLAYQAGRMKRKMYADPSSPLAGLI